MEDVIKIINNLKILDDDYVVLACSYGPDSMCLLDILKSLNKNIVVAHVNHKLRKESDKEYLDLEKYCRDNHIIFEGMEITKKPKGNLEEFFRNERYDFFKKIINKYQSKYLFTAHHGDDLVETILMRLSRGASFGGYAGFNIISEGVNYTLVRPLIYLTKDEILDYVNSKNIPYALDKTNETLDYTRNRYRLKVLPLLKEINPQIHKKFIKFSNTINEYNDYIQKEVDDYKSKLYLNRRLDLNEFNILPLLIRKCIIKSILLEEYENNINRVNDKHVDLVLDLINNHKRNSYINLPNGLVVSKYYNIVEFNRDTKIDDYNYELNGDLVINNNKVLVVKETDIIKSNYLIRINSKDIKLPLYIRNRKVGDKIELKNGTKKVGEILSESKIPKKERDGWPIMVDSNGKILWILGLKKSKFDKQVREDYDIIVKYVKKGEKNEEEK